MPLQSKSQARLMYESLKNKMKTKVKPSVAKEFIDATPKSMFDKLKERINKKKY